MIDQTTLHDLLFTNLEQALLNTVDQTLARASFNLDDLPSKDVIAGIIKTVLTNLASHPGGYWIPDDINGKEPS